MLSRALEGVTSQIIEPGLSFEVIVVDNDNRRSAEDIVRLYQRLNTRRIVYDCEPIQNIALARNRAILNATGNLIAFMDDDEFPVEDWLVNLYRTMKKYQSDGVLGPVIPFFPQEAPQWLRVSKVCDRRRLQTGTLLTDRDTRTGNVLLNRRILPKDGNWFNPVYGLTGGEDQDFFRRQINSGGTFVWCDEAEVYETVPEERWRASFHLTKNSRAGTLYGEALRQFGLAGLVNWLKNAVAAPLWLSVLLITFPFGKPVWMIPATRFCYAGSCFLAFCGLSLMRNRP